MYNDNHWDQKYGLLVPGGRCSEVCKKVPIGHQNRGHQMWFLLGGGCYVRAQSYKSFLRLFWHLA